MALGAAAAGAWSGCATYAPPAWSPGTPASEVLKVMGPPTGKRHPTAEAPTGATQRWEYARGPMGHHTYMLDFDAQERLLAITQVLTEARFQGVQPGMSEAALLDWLGRPSDVRVLPRQQQHVWSYRYENSFCLWLEVSLSQDGHTVDVGQGSDPWCEKKVDQ